MQGSPRVYGFSGLIAVLGLVALLVGLVVTLLLPGIRYVAWGIAGLGVLLLAAAFIIDFRRVSSALTGRRGVFSTGTTVMASISVGIILLANAISIGNYQRFDVTSLAQFTLTSQTKDVLGKMERPVRALCFFIPQDPYGIGDYAANLLGEYQNYTDQLSVELIDPDEHPDQARRYGIIEYQTVVFESQDGQRLVWPYEIMERAEHAFTSAILEVTGIVQKKVYFLTGHGESSINSDYSSARESLLDNLYWVETLDLLRTPAVPEDCAALIIAGPRRSLTGDEVEAVEHYLESGGRGLILVNPESPPEIRRVLSAWGVVIEDGTVVDRASYLAPSIDSPSVPRTRNVFAMSTTYFPGATAIIPQEEMGENIEMVALVWTSKDSWLERDFDPSEEPSFDEEIDREGPLALGVLITTVAAGEAGEELPQQDGGTRMVVFGDSDFASNEHFYNGNNGDLFLNSVNWLAEETELISIHRKVLPFRRLVVGPEVVDFIKYSSTAVLPLVVLVIGGLVWWRRR